MSQPRSIGLAIPAYKDAESLRRCLLSVSKIAPALLAHTVVVDDSGDGQIAWTLKAEFNSIRWIAHGINLGFGKSATEAVLTCDTDLVLLLNDDTELVTLPEVALQTAFSDESLFAVTLQSHRPAGEFREGAKRLVWPGGFPRILHSPKDQLPARNGLAPSAYAVGGHAIYDRRKFAELHGFDPLFDPFYWEDVDLCLRAQRRGWQTVFVPEGIVLHHERGSIRSSFEDAVIREITLRNRLLFARRHASGLNRSLLGLSIACRWTVSLLTGDATFRHALKAARKQQK
jgi:GT2 family glycosyltransferase